MQLKCHKGFTLIEIIIVLLIVAIVATFASLRFTAMDDQREMRLFAEGLKHELQLANQVAQLIPAELGFDSQRPRYQFYRFVSNGDQWVWEVIDDIRLLKPQLLPDKVNISIIQSDPSRLITFEENTQWIPPIQFFSNGEITPFQIIIHQKSDAQANDIIISNLGGEIEIQ